MIFSPKLARLIIAGRKTQTRRKVKDDEAACRYKSGRHYALQVPAPKGSRARALTKDGYRLEVLDTRCEMVGEISFEDARAEGFKSREEFFDYWRLLYGPRADLEQFVWAISFRLFGDPPNFLHVDSSHGYTSNHRDALPDEPEAVHGSELSELTGSREAMQRYDLQMATERMQLERLPLSERIRRLEECPDIDLTRNLARIRQGVEAAEAKRRRLATTTKVPSDCAA